MYMRTEPSFSAEPGNHLDSQEPSVNTSGSAFDSGSSLLSDYRQRYGLSTDPFADDPHFPFYTGAQRRLILEQLLHVCRFSDNLLVVAGEYGVGKTRMAQALIDGLDDADDICFVEGQINSDLNSLLADVLAQFELATEEDFFEFCRKNSENDGLVVLIVDNAHHLTDEVVADLLGVLQENLGSRLHLVLFSEPYLLNRLENIEAPDIVLTDFLLEKFSLAEAVDYLNFRMEMADYLGPEVFVEAKVEPWWRQSQGQLLLLHEHAQEQLLASVSVQRSSRHYGYGVKRSLPIPHLVATSVLIGGLFLGYLYWDDDSAKKSTVKLNDPIPVPASSEARAIPPTSSAPVAAVVTPKSVPAQTAAASVNVSTESSTEKTSAVKQSVVPLAQMNELRDEHVQKSASQAKVSSAKDITKTEPTGEPAKVITKTDVVAEPKVASGFSEQEKVILGWDGAEYTLQLVGLSNEKAAREFIASQPNKKDLLLFRTLRQGKDWFVVVTGHFSSSAKARQAIPGLPESQKKASPWPREVKVIQGEIKQR